MANRARSLQSDRGGVALARRVVETGAGRAVLEQQFSGTGTLTVVTHRAFTWSIVHVEAGTLAFESASGRVEAPPRFELVVPPRSLLRMRFDDARVWSEGTGGFVRPSTLEGADPARDRLAPWIASADSDHRDWLKLDPTEAAPPRRRIDLDADRAVSRRIVMARRLLHDDLGWAAPIDRTARAIGVRRETLSRQFHAAYGIAPKAYCHRARLFDAVIRLLEGRSVIDTALDSGFADLSRFYANFRALTGSTPARYRRAGHEARRHGSPIP